MPDRDDRPVRFYDLNWLGKTVFLGGTAVRLTANLIDRSLERAADIVVESERAFKQGRDPNIEDAKILDEYVEQNER